MKTIHAKAEILSPDISNPKEIDEMLQRMELAGRTCYKSTDKITPESARIFIKKLVANHHEAMLEHASMTVRFTVDRGVTHELVRHRIASFAQESTRYCNYSNDKFGNEITTIKPIFFEGNPSSDKFNEWYKAMCDAEEHYFRLIELGATAQEARTVLPNSLKAEIIVTANMREWRHFFNLRAAAVTGMPHPQMLEVAVPLFEQCKAVFPELFSDIQIPEKILEMYGRKGNINHGC